jgi:hypothetical protein
MPRLNQGKRAGQVEMADQASLLSSGSLPKKNLKEPKGALQIPHFARDDKGRGVDSGWNRCGMERTAASLGSHNG